MRFFTATLCNRWKIEVFVASIINDDKEIFSHEDGAKEWSNFSHYHAWCVFSHARWLAGDIDRTRKLFLIHNYRQYSSSLQKKQTCRLGVKEFFDNHSLEPLWIGENFSFSKLLSPFNLSMLLLLHVLLLAKCIMVSCKSLLNENSILKRALNSVCDILSL